MADKETKTEERLGKISENLGEINKTIKEIWSKSEPRTPNRDVDLQKIQVLDSNYQTWFNLIGSVYAGGFVGLLILATTLYYEGPLRNLILIGLAYLVVFVGIFYGLRYLKKEHDRHLKFISDKTERVQKGELLKSLWEEREFKKWTLEKQEKT